MCWRGLILALLLICVNISEVQASKLLYIPMDTRPVCLDYTLTSLQAAGVQVAYPDREFLADNKQDAQVDKLFSWLERELPVADAVVLSTDSLIYGGLVGSRTHELPLTILQARLQRLLDLLDKYQVPVYAYSTIMRTPRASSGRVEPAYYAQYGAQIFRYTQLQDKQELEKLSPKEWQEYQLLQQQLPQAVLTDWQTRRDKNLIINQRLLEAVQAGKFTYFILGKDDTAVYSASHREARILGLQTENLLPNVYGNFVGADQLGLVLAVRAVSSWQQQLPFIYVDYNQGVAGKTIPSYEDMPLEQTVKAHIWAAGAFETKSLARADLVLALNTPADGVTLEASNPVNSVDKLQTKAEFLQILEVFQVIKKPVALADVAYGNGADNALVAGLFQKDLAWNLAAYAGWNTASNSLGYALGQGILSPQISREAREKLLAVRYLDEWAYQANVRQQVYQQLVWPEQLNGQALGLQTAKVEAKIATNMRAFIKNKMPASYQQVEYKLPWQRMFEVQVKIN
ncbi:DUF4127 family protein [Succinispira mobilis]|uniref:DUF4127 family protein n=1 Tax=Succinispira mobilis TaxID=78120 RepID=UPI000377AC7D|nr:DUF4127 family protein [Succinispira mobilis]